MTKYFLGLDIGTNSCGWAVTDQDYNLIRRKGKDLWGVRLFEGAHTAEERRQKRTNRRRLDRKKLELSWVRDIFAEEVAKVDKDFLTRMKYSNLWMEDKNKMSNSLKSKDSLFHGEIDGRFYSDKDYYSDYPTIYHLRKELIHTPAKDIRLLYLAVHNIIKHRGHFLYGGSFGENSDLINIFNEVLEVYTKALDQDDCLMQTKILNQEDVNKILECIKSKSGIKVTKSKFNEIFCAKSKSEKALVGAFVDGKINLEQLFDSKFEDGKLDFNDEAIESKLNEIGGSLSDEQLSLLYKIQEIYSLLQLKTILGDCDYICDAMVESYDKHQSQLEIFKKFIKKYYKEEYFNIFRNSRDKNSDKNVGYAQYVNCNLINGKKQVVDLDVSSKSKEDFYKYILKILSENPKECADKEEFERERDYFVSLIQEDKFLPKQRTKANSVLPNKLYEKELKQILQTNAKKYDFLNEIDESCGLTNSQKLLQILFFRVPYFVGPIGQNLQGQKHGWAEKIANLDYKPWTLNKIINFDSAEDAFIGKMTNKCTYLKDKDVLPKNSIINSKFRVLNELNKLKINGNNISVELKQALFNQLFCNFAKVSSKDVKKFLIKEGLFSEEEMNDIHLSGIDKEFANNYSSYSKLATHPFFGHEFVDKHLFEIEKIIKYHTIISDKNRLDKRIRREFGDVFSDEQFKYLKGLNFKDWGSLSYEFICGIKFINRETGEITTILDELWITNQNLQEILANGDYTLSEKLFKSNDRTLTELIYDDVENLYCSPAVKRGIWQTIKLIKEIVSVMGQMPEKVFVEVTREDGEKGDAGRKSSRKDKLESLYTSKAFKKNVFISAQEIAQLLEELNTDKDVNSLRSERLYLYFLQAGKCMYSGQTIDIKDIFNDNLYDVDHIIPQAIIKDDSIDNKVLVKRQLNAEKSDRYPLPYEYIAKQKDFWKVLLDNGFISKEKYDRLIRTAPLTDNELGQFIARQLVETNQSVKAVIDFLKESMANTRKVVYNKAKLVTEFRQTFSITKCRDINDLHHAQDAYLNIVVGNIINSKFTDDPRNFYRHKKDLDDETSTASEQNTKSNNILHLFWGNVYSSTTGKLVWSAKKDIARIKEICQKTSPLISKMSFSKLNGAFYKETVHKSNKNNKKTEASVSIKGDESSPLFDTEKYGGYNNLNNAYFMLIESKNKKNQTIKTIEAVPIMVVIKNMGKADFKENILEYISKASGLKDAKILIDKINFQSTLLIGKGRYVLGGKSGDQLVLHNANQIFLDDESNKYIKAISKYFKHKADKTDLALKQSDEFIEVSPASKKGNKEIILTKEQNLRLYEKFIEKLSCKVYDDMQLSTILLSKLKDKKAIFISLNVQDQVQVLHEIVKKCSCGTDPVDLSKLQDGKSVGKITINKNITGKKIVLIKNSVSGLFEQRIVL